MVPGDPKERRQIERDQRTGNLSREAPDKVDVNPIARDDEIASRLTRILDSTDYFVSPEVMVENGVVFLKGEAREPEYRSWAGDLARNTQDVAAVVNRMNVAEQSIWDFSAVFAGLRAFQASTIQAIPIIIFGFVVLVLAWLLAKLTSRLATWLLVGECSQQLVPLGYLAGDHVSDSDFRFLYRSAYVRVDAVGVDCSGRYWLDRTGHWYRVSGHCRELSGQHSD